MTSKDKAIELYQKYYEFQPLLSKKEAKYFALICVNNIIAANPHSNPLNNSEPTSMMLYWFDVKKEIEKL